MSKFITKTPQKICESNTAVNVDKVAVVTFKKAGTDKPCMLVMSLENGDSVRWQYDSEQAARDDFEKLFLA